MFLGMDIYSWIAAIVIALIVAFLPITLPFKIVLAMVAMACFYFGRKYYHNHKNGGAKTPSMSSAESEALASGILKALGGKDNIAKVDYCATRSALRYTATPPWTRPLPRPQAQRASSARPRTPARWSSRVMCRPCTMPCASSCNEEAVFLRKQLLEHRRERAAAPGPGGIFIGKEF